MKQSQARILGSFFSILIATFFLTGIAWGGENHSAKPDAGLTETYWKATSLNGQMITLGTGKRELHMVLTSKNKVRGFSGCNRFMGSYKTDADQIQIGPLAATMMMCMEAMEQEQGFLKTLESSVRFSIKGEKLTLYNDEKHPILQFESIHL